MNGVEAVEAIQYMSIFGDVLLQSAEVNGLYDWGYAATGVCDDACGAIEVIFGGESTEYPNLVIKPLVCIIEVTNIYQSMILIWNM